MLKTIKLKYKLLESSNNEEAIKILSLEIYCILLGYFAAKKDNNSLCFNNIDNLNELEERIKKLLKTSYRILGIKNNSLESFKCFMNNIQNYIDRETYITINNSFTLGYNYYNLYKNKYNSIYDYNKHKRFEYTLNKYLI